MEPISYSSIMAEVETHGVAGYAIERSGIKRLISITITGDQDEEDCTRTVYGIGNLGQLEVIFSDESPMTLEEYILMLQFDGWVMTPHPFPR